jgi:hypothetical protein
MNEQISCEIGRREHLWRFNARMVCGTRLAANPATRRSNSHPAGFFFGLAHQFGAFMSRLQTIGGTARFVQKEAVVTRTNRRPQKEIRINERRIRSQLTSSLRPARSSRQGSEICSSLIWLVMRLEAAILESDQFSRSIEIRRNRSRSLDQNSNELCPSMPFSILVAGGDRAFGGFRLDGTRDCVERFCVAGDLNRFPANRSDPRPR